MDDDGRCLSDVIGDPLALEFFLQASEDARVADPSNANSSRHVPSVQTKPRPKRPPKPRRKSSTTVSSSTVPPSVAHVGSLTAASPNAVVTRLPSQLHPNHQQRLSTASPSSASFQPSGPSLGGATQSPMPPPPPTQSPGASSSHRSPSSAASAYPQLAQSPVAAQNVLYTAVRSPTASPMPTAATAAASYVQVARTQGPMAPAALGIMQHRSSTHSPVTIPVSSAPATMLSSAIPVGGQIMQFIQASMPSPHQYRSAKSKQPQQILPKPAAGQMANIQPVPHGRSAASSRAVSAAAAASSASGGQAGSLVLGQGQAAMLANASNVSVGPQGTLLLNHFSLGQNQILIPSGHGLPQNLQLVMRPSQATAAAAGAAAQGSVSQQANGSQSGPTTMNGALIAALQAQAQAAAAGHSPYLGQAKPSTASAATAAAGTAQMQGQAVVMSTSQGMGQAMGGQAHQMIRPGIIGGTRVVSQMNQMSQAQAAPLVLQQIQTPQGPITVAISATQLQALQSCGLGVSGPGLTLANPTQAPQMSGGGGVLQGSFAQQGFVVNNQANATSPAVAYGESSEGSCQMAQVTQLQHHQQQQQQICQAPLQLQLQQTQQIQTEMDVEQQEPPLQQQQQQQQPEQPKVHGVNLEELLKQAGIMPEDSSPSPPPQSPQQQQQQPLSPPPALSSPLEQYQSVVTFAPIGGVPIVQNDQQQQQSTLDAVTQSQLIAQLQQPMMAATHLQAHGQLQTTQVKVALGQDGHFYIQRPVFPTAASAATQMTLAHHPQVSFPMSSLGLGCTVTSTANSSPVTVSTSTTQPVHPLLLQGLHTSVGQQQHQQADQQQQPPQLLTSDSSQSILPFTVQGINAIGLVSAASLQAAVSGAMTTTMSGLSVATSVASTASSNAILGSMLSHGQSAMMQGIADDRTYTSGGGGKPAVIQQNPLLAQSLQTNFSGVVPSTSQSVGGTRVSTSATIDSGNPSKSPAGSSTAYYSPEFTMVPATMASTAAETTNAPVTAAAVVSSVPCAARRQQQCQTASSLVVAGYPIMGAQPFQKVQTIQLRPQDQEALQRIQAQLKAIVTQRPQTAQHLAQIQQLQGEQQRILSLGKVISVHQQPAISQQQKQQFLNQLGPNQSTFQPQEAPKPKKKWKKKKKKPPAVPTSVPTSIPGHTTSVQVTHTNAATSTGSTSTSSFAHVTIGSSDVPASAICTSAAATALTTTSTTTHMKIGNQVGTLTSQQHRQSAQHLQLAKGMPDQHENQQQQQQQPSSAKQALMNKLQQPGKTKSTATVSAQVSTWDASTQASGTVNYSTGVSQQTTRGAKRAASLAAARANAFHQRVTNDQNAVLKPDCKTPFRSREDACKRLLCYHVYSSKMWSEEEIRQDDEHFEAVSRQLLDRTNQMLNKYRYLLLRESMKETSTAERVMLERVFIQDETACLQQDRLAVKEGKELDLPPPPNHWLEKLRAMGSPSPPCEPLRAVVGPLKIMLPKKCDETAAVIATIKQEPVDKPEYAESGLSPLRPNGVDFSSSGGPGGVRCKEETKTDEKSRPTAALRGKNYDEWAEIQKELEMYPLEHDVDSGPDHLQFEDGSTALVDFEPPMPKLSKDDAAAAASVADGSAYNGQHYSYHHRLAKSHHPHHRDDGCDLEAKWGDVGHEFRTDGHHLHHHHQHHEVADLLQTTFKSPVSSPLDDVLTNGAFDRLQDEDLNAQVESAINSILNLQRIDESGVRDAAFVASVVQQQCQVAALHLHQQQQHQFGGTEAVTAVASQLQSDAEDDTDEDAFGGTRSSVSDKVDEHTMDYDDDEDDDESSAAQLSSYAPDDGPSEMDVALDEAVKSILL